MPVALTEIEPHLAELSESPEQEPTAGSPRNVTYQEAKGRAILAAAKWPSVSQGARDNETYRHAAYLRKDFGLSAEDTLEIIRDWNHTNNPPLTDEELREKVDNAEEYGKHAMGAKLRQRQMKRNSVSVSNTLRNDEQQDDKPITVVNAGTLLATDPPAPDQILADTFDRGDKVAVIGSSKLRKSFFCLQKMLSIASGRDFLKWSVPKPRRVFIVQFEIQAHHFHRRVKRMASAMGITPTDLGDRLQIVNARGRGITGTGGIRKIIETAKPFEPDIIFMDPLYKIASGVENAAEDFKVILNAFDELAVITGASVVFVHHDAKGFSGDRDVRDRGAGSNVLGRDYDACLTLTPHASEPDTAVVETLLRNYRPQEPFTTTWTEDLGTGGYCFTTRTDILPTKQTSANARKQNETPFDALQPVVEEILANGPLAIKEFKERLRTKGGLSYNRTDAFTRWALLEAQPPLDVYETRGKGQHVKYIGTAEQIAGLRRNHDGDA